MFNPFQKWFIVLVIIPVQLLCMVSLLPYYLLRFIKLGEFYKKIHMFIWMNIEQFTLQPITYCKHLKDITSQIIDECNKL